MAKKLDPHLVIPDLQAPFQHKDAIPFLKRVQKDHGISNSSIICIGDELDHHALSKYAKDPDGYSAGSEIARGLEFMDELYSAFPTVKITTSNHGVRPWKRAHDSGIPKMFLKSYKEALRAPKSWVWKDEWIVNNVKYIHGEGFSGQQAHFKAAMNHRMSTVIGHIHAHAGIQYISNGKDLTFGLNCGALIAHEAYAFAYSRKMAFKPTLGCGVVYSSSEAYFVPYY